MILAGNAKAATFHAIVKEAGNYFRPEHALVVCAAHASSWSATGFIYDLYFAPHEEHCDVNLCTQGCHLFCILSSHQITTS